MVAFLARLQRGLERMYRIDTALEIGDFVLDAAARARVAPARMPREQLLLAEVNGELELGLFVDQAALDNLARHDPTERLHDGNLDDFLLAIEGVSHFVYVAWRARSGQSVSVLELELQAEVDKYVTCLLTTDSGQSDLLRRRLFEQVSFHEDLDDEERERYQAANSNAHRYSASLERRYVHGRRIAEMLRELRRFYRMSLRAKLDLIASAA